MVPELAGYEQLMYAICQVLKRDKDLGRNDTVDSSLLIDDYARGEKLARGTLPYTVGEPHCVIRILDDGALTL